MPFEIFPQASLNMSSSIYDIKYQFRKTEHKMMSESENKKAMLTKKCKLTTQKNKGLFYLLRQIHHTVGEVGNNPYIISGYHGTKVRWKTFQMENKRSRMS